MVGLHPALCQPRTGLRNWGPNFPNCSAPVPSRISVIKTRPTSPATATVIRENPAALRSSAAGSFQAVTPLPPRASEEESRPSTPRYGFAVFIPACYSSTPLPGRIPPEVFRAGRRQAVPAAGADSVSHRRSALRHSPPPRIRAACHRLRREDSARPDGQEPSTFVSAMSRPGSGPGGRLPSHNVGLFRCSREPCVSLPRRSRARRPSRCQTASRATLHSLRSFRALGHWETLSRAPARTA